MVTWNVFNGPSVAEIKWLSTQERWRSRIDFQLIDAGEKVRCRETARHLRHPKAICNTLRGFHLSASAPLTYHYVVSVVVIFFFSFFHGDFMEVAESNYEFGAWWKEMRFSRFAGPRRRLRAARSTSPRIPFVRTVITGPLTVTPVHSWYDHNFRYNLLISFVSFCSRWNF